MKCGWGKIKVESGDESRSVLSLVAVCSSRPIQSTARLTGVTTERLPVIIHYRLSPTTKISPLNKRHNMI